MKSKNTTKFLGDINYGAKVVESIIALATLEIRGVESFQGRKISIERNGDILNIDVFIDVLISVKCSDVAFRVQENIKRSIESMTDFKTGTINVNILGVKFDEKNWLTILLEVKYGWINFTRKTKIG